MRPAADCGTALDVAGPGLVDKPTGVDVASDRLPTPWEGIFAIGDNANLPASKTQVVARPEMVSQPQE